MTRRKGVVKSARQKVTEEKAKALANDAESTPFLYDELPNEEAKQSKDIESVPQPRNGEDPQDFEEEQWHDEKVRFVEK